MVIISLTFELKNIADHGVPVVAQWLTNPTRHHEVEGSIPALPQWVKDPALLWLWRRPATTAPIRPLAWEPPYAAGTALEMAKIHTHTQNITDPLLSFTYLFSFPSQKSSASTHKPHSKKGFLEKASPKHADDSLPHRRKSFPSGC